jgi:hypothetical protein
LAAAVTVTVTAGEPDEEAGQAQGEEHGRGQDDPEQSVERVIRSLAAPFFRIGWGLWMLLLLLGWKKLVAVVVDVMDGHHARRPFIAPRVRRVSLSLSLLHKPQLANGFVPLWGLPLFMQCSWCKRVDEKCCSNRGQSD